MYSRLFSRMATTCFILLALGVTTAQAGLITLTPGDSNSYVTLDSLLNSNSDDLLVGDKMFSDFFYSTLPNDDMPAPENVKVFGFTDLDGNYGVSFHGAFWDIGDDNTPSDALLRFTVEVSDAAQAQGWRISDAHLFIGGVGIGSDSFFSVDETFEGLDLNESLNAHASTIGSGSQKISDAVYFDKNYTKLRVTKDILAFSRDPNQPARVTAIDQSFSQTQIVPEPATMSLIGLALLGLVASRRKS